MEFGKYIVVETHGCEVAIMFDLMFSHDIFLDCFSSERILSAGFFEVGAKASIADKEDVEVSIFGKSTTLGKSVRQNKDERLLKRVMRKH